MIKLSDKQARATAEWGKLEVFINSTPNYRCRRRECGRTIDQQYLYFCGYRVGYGLDEDKDPSLFLIKCQPASETLQSQHLNHLAQDLVIDRLIDGVWVTLDKTEDYAFAGAFWKSLNPENVWGGDWGWDGGHFEVKG